MTTVILSGATGVGKTTVQRALVKRLQARTLTTYTTREVEDHETEMVSVLRDDIIGGVKKTQLVAPASFGKHLYAWSKSELKQAQAAETHFILNVRPYTALLLWPFLPNSVPILLDAPMEVIIERRAARGEQRDKSGEHLEDRVRRDLEELEAYRELFPHIMTTEGEVVEKIIAMVRDADGPRVL